jgi:predicted RNA-binding protein YlxR (DUF448 family)
LVLLYPEEDPLESPPKIPKVRIPKVARGEEHGNNQGRGAWVCRSDSCFSKLSRKNILERAFRTKVDANLHRIKDPEPRMEDITTEWT